MDDEQSKIHTWSHVCAHRGISMRLLVQPENTLSSYRFVTRSECPHLFAPHSSLTVSNGIKIAPYTLFAMLNPTATKPHRESPLATSVATTMEA